MSKMTVINDNLDRDHYSKLSFVEFLEFMVRIALLSRLEISGSDAKSLNTLLGTESIMNEMYPASSDVADCVQVLLHICQKAFNY